MKFQIAVPDAFLLSNVSAHTIFTQLQSGGTQYSVGYGIRDPSYDGPIQDVTTNYIACNGGPNPTTPSSNVINVKAGDTVKATWRHTLTSTAANDQVYVIDPSHKGPVMAYMKKVNDATTDPGYGSGWFKISQGGLNPATQDWAVTDLMECAQIKVTGGTGISTPSTVSFPGAYSASDPGILINIYQTLSSYAIPGPAPFTCGASSSPTTPVNTSPTSPTSTTKPTTLSTSKISTSVTPAGTNLAAAYAQCGGTGWTGATACATGTCKVVNTYYSQCLP